MEMALQTVHDPMRIGFVSYTRAARAEAAQRVSDKFGISLEDLEKRGWFKTIHSVCHRVLNVGDELLTGGRESRRWIAEALGEEVSRSVVGNDGETSEAFEVSTEAGKCLHIWDVARARLEPLETIWDWHDNAAPGLCPHYGAVLRVAKQYEEAKRREGRLDFTDLLLRVAGRRHLIEFVDEVMPEGELPLLPVWFFDEQQDTSALSDLVCRRIILGANWVYLVGDPFQSIYAWSGADPKHFQSWPIPNERKRILNRSFRCPSRILAQGEEILRPCSDYFDRGIQPNEEGGEIIEESLLGGWEQEMTNGDTWLCLARTNKLAFRVSQMLDHAGIPWGYTQGVGSRAPSKAAAIGSLYSLEHGGIVDECQWKEILKILPSKAAGQEMLERGTKKRWEDQDADPHKIHTKAGLLSLGATEALVQMIGNGTWRDLVPEHAGMVSACETHGVDALINPKIRVGTIHSAKGLEADHVAVLTSITRTIHTSMQEQRGEDEERRVWYVAATRARKRTLWLNDYRDAIRFQV